jgi:hypothetical protein
VIHMPRITPFTGAICGSLILALCVVLHSLGFATHRRFTERIFFPARIEFSILGQVRDAGQGLEKIELNGKHSVPLQRSPNTLPGNSKQFNRSHTEVSSNVTGTHFEHSAFQTRRYKKLVKF